MDKQTISKNLPTIMSAAAGIGVGLSGYFSVRLGAQIEREKENLKSEDSEIRKGAKWRIAFKSIPVVGFTALTEFCIFKSNDISKKRLAKTTALLGATMKLFDDYRKKETPERDKEIMKEIALENAKEGISEEKPKENVKRWTDEFISKLSNGKVTYFEATEADVLSAAMYTKDTYYNHFGVGLDTFYSTLRDYCGVDIPEFKGESDIHWEASGTRESYYESLALDFNWTEKIIDGVPTNVIYWSETDDEIDENNRQLMGWFEQAKAKQDLLDMTAEMQSRN